MSIAECVKWHGMQLQYAVQASNFYCACTLQWVVFVDVDYEMFFIHICFAQSELVVSVKDIVLSLILLKHLCEACGDEYSRAHS